LTIKAYAWDQNDRATAGVLKSINADTTRSYSSGVSDIVIKTAYLNHLPSFSNSTYTAQNTSSDINTNTGQSWATTLSSLGYNDIDTKDAKGVSIVSLSVDSGLVGAFEVKGGGAWTALTAGMQFTTDTYQLYRYRVDQNLTVNLLNAQITINPYDGIAVNGSSSAVITIPVIKVNFAPSIIATLPAIKVRTFRSDNKTTPSGGVNLGISMKTFLDDMGFSDANVGEERGVAIENIKFTGVKGYIEYRVGQGKWTRISKLDRNQYFFLKEKQGAIMNRIRLVVLDPNVSPKATIQIFFYGWDVSEGYASGSYQTLTNKPASFSAQRGTYQMQTVEP
jgi:hypothetical protein